jgi:ABC-type multidrug transport system fused ATPase/permease subunit
LIIILGIATTSVILKKLTHSSIVPPTPKNDNNSIRHLGQRQYHWAILLFILGSTAFALTLTKILLASPLVLQDTVLLASWLLLVLVLVLIRPASASLWLLTIYLLETFLEIASTLAIKRVSTLSNLLSALVALCGLLSVIILLCMPINASIMSSTDTGTFGSLNDANENLEHSLSLYQYLTISWIWPLLVVGRQRQLKKEDIWTIRPELQAAHLNGVLSSLRQSTTLSRLLHVNAYDLTIALVIACLGLVLEFASPLLLQQFLRVIERPELGKRPAMLYAFILLARGVLSFQLTLCSSWFRQRMYAITRGTLSMAIYRKTLLRKNVINENSKKPQSQANISSSSRQGAVDVNNKAHTGPMTDDHSKPDKNGSRDAHDILHQRLTLFKELIWGNKESIAKATGPASRGQIVNMVASDVDEIASKFQSSPRLIQLPVGLIIALWMIWNLLGPSCLVGISVLIAFQILTVIIARYQMSWRKYEKRAKDDRVHITSTFIEVIRHLRWYAWQDAWLSKVFEVRQHELNVRAVRTLLSFSMYVTTTCAGALFPTISLVAYTAIGGKPLRIDLIFPALQLFASLQSRFREIPGFATWITNTFVSLERLDDFQRESSLEVPQDNALLPNRPSVKFADCNFAWPGQTTPTLQNITIAFPVGITLLYGEIGSGKTGEFLAAFLGSY